MNPSSSSMAPSSLTIDTKPVSFSKIDGKNIPIAREGHSACSVDDKLYIFGGVCQSTSDDCAESSDLLMFDSSTNVWMKIDVSGKIPAPRSAAVLNTIGKKLYLFGGLSQFSGWFNDVHVFDTENANWTKLDTAGTGPSGRDKLTSAVVGSKIYYFGGFGPKCSFESDGECIQNDSDEEYEDEVRDLKQQQRAADFGWFNDLYVLDTSTSSWNQPMQMNLGVPSMRAAHGMCILGQKLVIFGGRDPEGRQNDIHIFDTVSRKWLLDMKEKGCPPERRSFHTLTAVSDNLALVFGGRGETNEHFNDCYIFAISSNTWYKVPLIGTIPKARGCHTCTLVKDKLVIYGGSSHFIPEIQHCQEVLSDMFVAAAKDVINVISSDDDCTEGR